MSAGVGTLRRILLAGLVYFLIVFTAGFALGTARIFAMEPKFGAALAVLFEAPFMLAISWIVCGAVIRRITPPPTLAQRALMGGVAFALLLAAEITLGFALGEGLNDIAAGWKTPAGAIGLAGQLLFAAFPMMRR